MGSVAKTITAGKLLGDENKCNFCKHKKTISSKATVI